jgi:hypothetical protein
MGGGGPVNLVSLGAMNCLAESFPLPEYETAFGFRGGSVVVGEGE